MKILNFGSMNIDYSYYVDHFVKPGETIGSTDLKISCGGKGLNQSIAMARASAKVWHAGAVGEKDGKLLTDLLQENEVNIEYVETRACSSGHAIIQVTKNAENNIILFGGANQKITENQIEHTLDAFQAGDFLVLQNEINLMNELIMKAKERGIKVFFNPSPMDESVLRLPLASVDYFFLNEDEASALSSMDEADMVKQIEYLTRKYPDTGIIITVGSKGAYFFNSSMDKPIHQACFPMKAVDTTAAGDTFMGYFIASVSKGESPEQAMRIASYAASLSVSRYGAAASIPTFNEVNSGLSGTC